MAGISGNCRSHAGGGAITTTGACVALTGAMAWAEGAGVLMLSTAQPAREAVSDAVVTSTFTPGTPFLRVVLRLVDMVAISLYVLVDD
jgi:hypothetical protein